MNKDYREEECDASVCKGKKQKKTQQNNQQSSKSSNKEKEVEKIQALVMWYLPMVSRLRCLFAIPEEAKLMS